MASIQMAMPWEGSTDLAVAEASGKLVLLSDDSGSYYSASAPDGTPLGGAGVAQLMGAMEASVRRGDIKLPSVKDLEALAGQGTLIVDPTTGSVRVGSKAEADGILGADADDWTLTMTQVENSLQNAYQANLNYVPPEGGIHPQGGYIAKSGNYYPPAPSFGEVAVIKDSKTPTLFKKQSFSWRSLYHPFVGSTWDPFGDGSIIAEMPFSPTPMRMYTDHRVMGQIVLPGVSHVSLAAAVASVGMEGSGFKRAEFSINLHEVFFERPYLVNDGTDIIAMVNAAGGQAGMGAIPGTELTYCRVARVDKEYGAAKPVNI